MTHETANGARRSESYGTKIAEAEIFMAAWTGRDEDQRHPGAGLEDLRVQLAESNPRELDELRDAAQMLLDEIDRESALRTIRKIDDEAEAEIRAGEAAYRNR